MKKIKDFCIKVTEENRKELKEFLFSLELPNPTEWGINGDYYYGSMNGKLDYNSNPFGELLTLDQAKQLFSEKEKEFPRMMLVKTVNSGYEPRIGIFIDKNKKLHFVCLEEEVFFESGGFYNVTSTADFKELPEPTPKTVGELKEYYEKNEKCSVKIVEDGK